MAPVGYVINLVLDFELVSARYSVRVFPLCAGFALSWNTDNMKFISLPFYCTFSVYKVPHN